MRVFDFSFESPAENLALDEVLLERAERDESGECLRFWESSVPFVVLGLTQTVADHVHVDACREDGVAIQRRCTAGGCVLQAPGCLNFAFVLRQDRPDCDTIHGSYRVILGALANALTGSDTNVAMTGISDLAIGAHKISGNAQKRKRHYFLHHGTLLYRFDAEACSRYLTEPLDRPKYRGTRTHTDFIGMLSRTRGELVSVVSQVFRAESATSPDEAELEASAALARTKYSTDEWVYKR